MALTKHPFDPDNVASTVCTVRAMAAVTDEANQSILDHDRDLEVLLRGEMELQGLMPWSSNYTFLVKLISRNEVSLLGIYKPGDGERPLWDFPDGTLSQREFASYLVSQVLGWPKIPLTVIRDGDHGWGSVQRFIEAEYEAHYFNMRNLPAFTEDFRQMALFDYIVNNADRKGGHCLKSKNGEIWAIDHGLTFHTEPKLRTVIWEFSDEAVPGHLLQDLIRLQSLVGEPEFCNIMAALISSREIEAFKARLNRLVSTGYLPPLRSGRNVPFPPI